MAHNRSRGKIGCVCWVGEMKAGVYIVQCRDPLIGIAAVLCKDIVRHRHYAHTTILSPLYASALAPHLPLIAVRQLSDEDFQDVPQPFAEPLHILPNDLVLLPAVLVAIEVVFDEVTHVVGRVRSLACPLVLDVLYELAADVLLPAGLVVIIELDAVGVAGIWVGRWGCSQVGQHASIRHTSHYGRVGELLLVGGREGSALSHRGRNHIHLQVVVGLLVEVQLHRRIPLLLLQCLEQVLVGVVLLLLGLVAVLQLHHQQLHSTVQLPISTLV